MATLLYLIACFGLTFLLVDAAIFSRPRTWVLDRVSFLADMFVCYFCTGVWAAGALWCVKEFAPMVSTPLNMVLAGATVTYFLSLVMERLDSAPQAEWDD